jgi:uncharacterized protein
VDIFEALRKDDKKTVLRLAQKNPALLDLEQGGETPILILGLQRDLVTATELAKLKPILTVAEAVALHRLPVVISYLNQRTKGYINTHMTSGHTILGLAAFFGHEDIVEYLLGLGADPSIASTNHLQITPLHSAVNGGYLRVVELLLAAGVDPNVTQLREIRPLHQAAHHGHKEIVERLIQAGADPKLKSEEGLTAADYAKLAKRRGFTRLLKVKA